MPKNEKMIILIHLGRTVSNDLPDDYDQWSNEKLDDFIDDHKWEPFEDYVHHLSGNR